MLSIDCVRTVYFCDILRLDWFVVQVINFLHLYHFTRWIKLPNISLCVTYRPQALL